MDSLFTHWQRRARERCTQEQKKMADMNAVGARQRADLAMYTTTFVEMAKLVDNLLAQGGMYPPATFSAILMGIAQATGGLKTMTNLSVDYNSAQQNAPPKQAPEPAENPPATGGNPELN